MSLKKIGGATVYPGIFYEDFADDRYKGDRVSYSSIPYEYPTHIKDSSEVPSNRFAETRPTWTGDTDLNSNNMRQSSSNSQIKIQMSADMYNGGIGLTFSLENWSNRTYIGFRSNQGDRMFIDMERNSHMAIERYTGSTSTLASNWNTGPSSYDPVITFEYTTDGYDWVLSSESDGELLRTNGSRFSNTTEVYFQNVGQINWVYCW